ncbi:MAG: ribosome assembly RNA-binding protein YhbY [Gammaproteobacteria bacterium]
MITKAQQTQLRSKAHSLSPVVLLGQHGYTPAVAAEIDRALHDHELIKVKIPGDERDHRQLITHLICQELHAELVQAIGKVIVLYRKRAEIAK